jgi:all-trans-retinol 13,14-reductase
VEVRCLHEVSQITASSVREVTGVGLADGRSIPAGEVIYSAHPGQLAEALPPGSVRPAYRNRLAGLDNTPPVFISYFRCPGTAPGSGRNHYFWPGKRADGASFAVMAATPEARGACGARAIIELADADDVAIALAEQHGSRSRKYRDWKERRSQELLHRARKFAPDLLDRAELLAAATPASYRDWTGTIAGSIYGPKRPARGIPLSVKTPLKGLVLTGQGLLSPGIMGAAASGIIAAGEVIGQQAVWEVLGFR